MNEYLPLIIVTTAGALGAAVIVWAASYLWLRYRRARLFLVLVPVLVGAFFAYEALSTTNGYLASFVFGHPWATSGILVLGSSVLFFARATRRGGWCGLAAAGLLLGTFYLVIGAALIFGFRWRENLRVPLSHEVRAHESPAV